MQYQPGKNGGVESIAICVAYERRDQLIGTLMSLFGGYSASATVGTAVMVQWPQDEQIPIGVRASKNPTNGIAEFWISHIETKRLATQSK